MKNDEFPGLLICPFCQRPTSISFGYTKKKASRYENGKCDVKITMSARCNGCHARGPTVSGVIENVPNGAILPEKELRKLREEAAWKWNLRGQLSGHRTSTPVLYGDGLGSTPCNVKGE